jgi:hypothetical protein
MRWYGTDLVDRHGRIRAVVRPLGNVWEVHVPGREVVRAADEQAGRVLAVQMVCPPRVEERHT